MWLRSILLSGVGTFGTPDDSLQFDASPFVSVHESTLNNLVAPSISDSQCLVMQIYVRNGFDRDIYVGSDSASVGVPLQISVGGFVTTVTVPGKISLYFPPGTYLFKFTRQSLGVQQTNSIQDNPNTGAVGTTPSLGMFSTAETAASQSSINL